MIRIPFHVIQLFYVGSLPIEIVFPFSGKFYRMKWEAVPDRFKQLYALYLRLRGIELPEFLTSYNPSTLDVSDLTIPINLDICDEVPPDYPLGG